MELRCDVSEVDRVSRYEVLGSVSDTRWLKIPLLFCKIRRWCKSFSQLLSGFKTWGYLA